ALFSISVGKSGPCKEDSQPEHPCIIPIKFHTPCTNKVAWFLTNFYHLRYVTKVFYIDIPML
ncbi:MAG: hypothetical protein QN650_08765, partial [Nitrososphaeraceae archaeon]|nr:hypothetical protein [Nitrososphaeraceae archaeon]